MSDGFIKIPRSLYQKDFWKKFDCHQRMIVLMILSNLSYAKHKFNNHGTIIDLEIGQVCTTYREIAEWCGEDVSKDKVMRTIETLQNFSFINLKAGQRARQKKSIITLIDPETYNCMFVNPETGFATNLRQTCDKTEERKRKGKEKETPQTPLFSDNKVVEISSEFSIATSLLSDFFSSLLSILPELTTEEMRHTKPQLNAMEFLAKTYGPQQVRAVFTFAHQNEFWRTHVHTSVYLKKKFKTLLLQMQGQSSNSKISGGFDRRTKDIHGNPVENQYAGIF